MNMNPRYINNVLLAGLTLVVLNACGESDIDEIKQRELETVQRDIQAQAELEITVVPDVGAASSP